MSTSCSRRSLGIKNKMPEPVADCLWPVITGNQAEKIISGVLEHRE